MPDFPPVMIPSAIKLQALCVLVWKISIIYVWVREKERVKCIHISVRLSVCVCEALGMLYIYQKAFQGWKLTCLRHVILKQFGGGFCIFYMHILHLIFFLINSEELLLSLKLNSLMEIKQVQQRDTVNWNTFLITLKWTYWTLEGLSSFHFIYLKQFNRSVTILCYINTSPTEWLTKSNSY